MDQEETAMQMNKAKPNVAAADSKESPVWTVLWSIPFPFWVMMAEWGKSWERASLYYLFSSKSGERHWWKFFVSSGTRADEKVCWKMDYDKNFDTM